MANIINGDGLQLATRDELLTDLTTTFKGIYGADINLESSSPDGQIINILVQMFLDYQDLLMQIYNNFDPDNAIGVVLDQRVAINGIQRQAGTYTITNIDITTTEALNLSGLDQTVFPVYTVSDNAGNEWNLIDSVVIASATTTTLAFRSAVPGAVYTTPNTINNPVTIVLGVSVINNPTTYTTLGINEESDNDLKIRRQKSVALSSQGYLAGLIAALENINGMTTVKVYENVTASTDADGVESHSIWVIVGGTASDASVANAIYKKRNAGCGMHGTDKTYIVTQADGSLFVIRWDVVTTTNLFIKCTLSSLDNTNVPNYAGIKSGLVTNFVPGLYEQVNINDLATAIQGIDNNSLVTNAGFATSVGGTYYNFLTPSSKKYQFLVDAANIILLPLFVNSPNATVSISSGVVTTTLSIAHSTAGELFTAIGGHGTITFSKISGTGTITTGGLYVPPSSSGSAVIRATDDQGNYTNVSITIT